MTKTITIHLIEQPNGSVRAYTTAGSPIPGRRLAPAEALAMDLLNVCSHRASDVMYWHGKDKALELVRGLIDPEQFGYSVSAEVNRAAKRVLGMPLTAPQVGAYE